MCKSLSLSLCLSLSLTLFWVRLFFFLWTLHCIIRDDLPMLYWCKQQQKNNMDTKKQRERETDNAKTCPLLFSRKKYSVSVKRLGVIHHLHHKPSDYCSFFGGSPLSLSLSLDRGKEEGGGGGERSPVSISPRLFLWCCFELSFWVPKHEIQAVRFSVSGRKCPSSPEWTEHAAYASPCMSYRL